MVNLEKNTRFLPVYKFSEKYQGNTLLRNFSVGEFIQNADLFRRQRKIQYCANVCDLVAKGLFTTFLITRAAKIVIK